MGEHNEFYKVTLLEEINSKLDRQQKQLDKMRVSNNVSSWRSVKIFGGGLMITGAAGVIQSFVHNGIIGAIGVTTLNTLNIFLGGILLYVWSEIGSWLAEKDRQDR